MPRFPKGASLTPARPSPLPRWTASSLGHGLTTAPDRAETICRVKPPVKLLEAEVPHENSQAYYPGHGSAQADHWRSGLQIERENSLHPKLPTDRASDAKSRRA